MKVNQNLYQLKDELLYRYNHMIMDLANLRDTTKEVKLKPTLRKSIKLLEKERDFKLDEVQTAIETLQRYGLEFDKTPPLPNLED
jgi:hypothetical protein